MIKNESIFELQVPKIGLNRKMIKNIHLEQVDEITSDTNSSLSPDLSNNLNENLREEIISKRLALENLQTKLATNYRSVFVENMSSCSLISMLRGYIIVEKDFEIKSIDDINKYKKSLR